MLEWTLDFLRFLKSVVAQWFNLFAGAVITTTWAIYGQVTGRPLPVTVFWLSVGSCVFLAAFRAWHSEHRKAAQLESQMKSKIKVSCGRSVPQSVVLADGETWYRARLDLEGCTPVPDIEASVLELWEDRRKVELQECLVLTMYPGVMKTHDDKRTLNEGKPEFVDVIRVGNGIAHFPLKFYPRAVKHDALLKAKHTYRIIVVINSSSNRADRCTFEFEWTGDPQTSDIRLISVTPPLLAPG